MTASGTAKYWVLRLTKEDLPPRFRGSQAPEFAIQLLGRDGGPTERIAYVEGDRTSATLEGEEIPPRVFEVLKLLDAGTGKYLDRFGEEVEPF